MQRVYVRPLTQAVRREIEDVEEKRREKRHPTDQLVDAADTSQRATSSMRLAFQLE